MDQLLDMLSYKYGLLPDYIVQMVRSADVDTLPIVSRRLLATSPIEAILPEKPPTPQSLPEDN
ncbi:hypothetical protein [Nocardia sp. BMG111209]|uniref:hypothetical protein n=1 Tax=Nocardia sp. BMG111209 TaxID=1160137 RepID=UPI0012DC70EE|nr:hypothetical protein [Nocardia sp. BMG111209]